MFEWMNLWMNKWTNGWMDKWGNEWMSEWMNWKKRINESKWMHKNMNECMNKLYMNRKMN